MIREPWSLARMAVAIGSVLVGVGCSGRADVIAGWFDAAQGHPFAPLLAITAMVASGFVAAPLTLTMIPTLLLFGPGLGSLWTLTGATISAAVFFQIGSRGAAVAGRLGVPGLLHDRLSRLLEGNGIVAAALARFLPLAPYPVVNLALGASPIRFRDFLVGNLLGLLPWVGLYAVVGERLREAIVAPSLQAGIALLLSAIVIAAATVGAAHVASRLDAADLSKRGRSDVD